jgi:hypothetical protein
VIKDIEQAAFLAVKHMQSTYFTLFTLIRGNQPYDTELALRDETITLFDKLQTEITVNT